MKPTIKICGLREPTNLRAIASLDPDLLGFIFHPQSPRYAGPGFSVPAEIASDKRVGVFVNASSDYIEQQRSLHRLSWLQLHGEETVSQVKEGRAAGWRMIKAFSVDASFDFGITAGYEPFCDYFLFDTKGVHPGGNGYPFDWRILKRYRGHVPFLLSGGLHGGMLEPLRAIVHPQLAGFDFNSGVELAPGLKSVEGVAAIVQELKKQI